MALILTIAFILFILFIGYKLYIDWYYLTKKKKYNKSEDALNWYIKSNPLNRYMFRMFRPGNFKPYQYKILKDEKEEEFVEHKSKN